MDGCLLCFQKHKEYVGYIQANSTHWMELNVHNIIEKHLWPIECIQPYSWICNICWKVLFDFNNFYMMINERHNKRFETLNTMVIERLPDRKTIEYQYETEIFLEQNLPETTQRNTTNTIVKTPTLSGAFEIEKWDEEQAIKLETNTNNQVYCNIDLTNNEEIDEFQSEHFRDEIFLNENVNSDVQQNYSLCNVEPTRGELINNQTSIITNMEEEDLIAHVIFVNPTKAKRGRPRKISTRGRPRKNSTKGVLNNNMLESISNNTSAVSSKNNLGRPAKNTEKYIERKKHLWENRSTSRPIRKRKLPRKFLTNFGESTNSLIKNRKLYAFIKSTGKRGRPRKILISNLSREQNASSELVMSNTKQYQEICINNIPLKAKGKRGRPRKIFINNLDRKLEQVNKPCDNTVSTNCENDTSLITKNKPGRPRKDANKNTLTLGQKNELWTNRMLSRPKRKRKLPRKYFSNGIQVTERFLIHDINENSIKESLSTDEQKPSIKSELQEICDNKNQSKFTGKRGRPRKHLTNETGGVEHKQIVTTESSYKKVKTMPPTKRFISKLKHRVPGRPHKDLMRNYIATSVRCMQLFKHKHMSFSKSDNTKNVDGQ